MISFENFLLKIFRNFAIFSMLLGIFHCHNEATIDENIEPTWKAACAVSNFPKECNVIHQIYQSNQIPFQNINSDVCTWEEAFCDTEKNHVLGLNFRRKKLTTLPDYVFVKLNNLKYLNLSNNRFSHLTSFVFNGLHQLDTLELEHNDLEILPDDIFSDLSNLHVLSLEDNYLTQLSPTLFSNLPQLQKLLLRFNDLMTLPSTLESLIKLEYVDIMDNHILPSFRFKPSFCQRVSVTPSSMCNL